MTLTANLTTSSRRLDLLPRVSSSLHKIVTRLSLSVFLHPPRWLIAHTDGVGAYARLVVAVKHEETTFQNFVGHAKTRAAAVCMRGDDVLKICNSGPEKDGATLRSPPDAHPQEESLAAVVTVAIVRFGR